MIKTIIIGLIVLSQLCQIALIGKPRDPYTPEHVFFNIVANALIIWGIMSI